MRECPQMAWIVERLGDDLTEDDREAISRHISECSECADLLQRMARLAPVITAASEDLEEPRRHLSDNDLAAFAAHGYDAEGASAIVLHLSECRRCRDAFAAAHSALLCYQAEREQRSWWTEAIAGLRHVFATPMSAALGLTALLAYLAECLLFAFALVQVLSVAMPPAGYEAVPDWWPLSLIPGGGLRLALLVVACLGLALLLRGAAARLYAAARERGGRR